MEFINKILDLIKTSKILQIGILLIALIMIPSLKSCSAFGIDMQFDPIVEEIEQYEEKVLEIEHEHQENH